MNVKSKDKLMNCQNKTLLFYLAVFALQYFPAGLFTPLCLRFYVSWSWAFRKIQLRLVTFSSLRVQIWSSRLCFRQLLLKPCRLQWSVMTCGRNRASKIESLLFYLFSFPVEVRIDLWHDHTDQGVCGKFCGITARGRTAIVELLNKNVHELVKSIVSSKVAESQGFGGVWVESESDSWEQ